VLAIVLAAVEPLHTSEQGVRHRISVRRPGRTVSGFIIAIWPLAIYTFIVAFYVTGVQVRQVHLLVRAPNADFKVHIGTTLTFLVILYITRRFGWRTALSCAFNRASSVQRIGRAGPPNGGSGEFEILLRYRATQLLFRI
jgi:hypothetical protein